MLSLLKEKLSAVYGRIHRRRRLYAVIFAYAALSVIVYATYGTDAVVAATGGTPVEITFVPDFILRLFARINLVFARLFLSLTLFLLTFVIEIAGYNGYLDATTVTVGWVMVRDFANMFFVVALLLIAFGTILGLEHYEWKKMLVKLVFAAILVNFSRLICGVLIDLAQVIMITFVNGIAATAGGNLINAFNLDKIASLDPAVAAESINASGVFLASIGAVVFTGITMMIMLYFLALLLMRMVVIWVLVVLSPLAFVFKVIPQTESYADQWWSEFSKNLITGPVLLFFVWLAFVTVGNGDAHSHVASNTKSPNVIHEGQTLEADQIAGGQSSGVSQAMSWNNMANFAISIGMLFVGIMAAQQIGGYGAGALSGALDFGKKVALLAGGIAAGKWVGGKAWQGAKAGAKYGALGLYMGSGLEDWVHHRKNDFSRLYEGYRSWKYDTGLRPKFEKDAATGKYLEKDGKLIPVRNPATGAIEYEQDPGLKFRRVHRWLHGRAQQSIQSDKTLEKVKKQAEVRKELLDKHTTGVPRYFLQSQAEREIDALDRMEQGRLEGEQERSAGKTREYKGLGKELALGNQRYKYSEEGVPGFQTTKGRMIEQVVEHEERGKQHETALEEQRTKARAAYMEGKGSGIVSARVQAEIQVKAAQAQAERIEATAKFGQLQTAAGILAQQQTVKEKAATEAAEALTTLAEGEKKREFLESAEGRQFTALQTAAEKGAHLEGERVEEVKKEAETEFYRGAHGKDELQEEAEIKARMTEMDTEIRRRGSEGRVQAAITQAGALQRTKEEEKKMEAEEGEVKRREATADRIATVTQAASVQRTREEELLSGQQETETKELEEEAKRAARTAQRAALEATKQSEVRTGATVAEVKEQEERARIEAQSREKAALERGKQAEVRTGAVDATGKRQEAEAKEEASRRERAALQTTKEQDVLTGRSVAKLKELETEALTQAQIKQKTALDETKQAEFRTGALDAIAKRQEAAAKQIAATLERAALDTTRAEEIKAGRLAAQTKQEEEAAKARVSATAPIKDELQKTAEAERRSKVETQKFEKVKKEQERIFAESTPGEALAEEDARVKMQTTSEETKLKRAEAKGKRDFIVKTDATTKEAARLLEETAEAQLGTQASEGDIKLREAQEKFNAMRGGGAAAFARIQATGLQQRGIDSQTKGLESAGKLKEMRTAEGKRQLRIIAEQEQQTQTFDARGKAIEEQTKKRYLISKEGRRDMRRRQAALMRTELASGAMKRAETEEKSAFTQSQIGRHIVQQLNLDEQGKKSADTFMALVKDEDLRNAYAQSRNEMEAVIKQWENSDKSGDAEELSKMMKKAADKSAYISAMRISELSKVRAREKKVREAQAVDSAADGVVNLQKGKRMPSTAMDSVDEEVQRSFAGQERADGSKNAADTMFYIMAKPKGKMTLDDRIEMLGSWGKVDGEAWNDDFADYMVRQIKAIKEKDPNLKGRKLVIAQQMEKMRAELDLQFEEYEATDEKGNSIKKFRFKDGYDRKLSSTLQGLATSGGDMQLLGAHRAISNFQKEHKEQYDKLGGYWKVAEYLAADTAGPGLGEKAPGVRYTASDLENDYRTNEDFIKVAAIKYKKNGQDNGHWESVLNQEFDDSRDLYRFNTEMDAAAGSVTEIGKRTMIDLLKAQVHSYGNLDLNNFLMKSIDPQMFGAITAQLKETYDANKMNFRSLIRLFDYHETEQGELRTEVDTKKVEKKDKNGKTVIDRDTGKPVMVEQTTKYGQIGGARKKKSFRERYKDEKEANVMMDLDAITEKLVPMMEGNATAFAIMLSKLFNGHVDAKEASHGALRLIFDSEEFGKVENVSELKDKIKKHRKLFIDKKGMTDEQFDGLVNKLTKLEEQFKFGVVSIRGGAPRAVRAA